MSETIKRIIHISDIHVPKHPKRHNEYKKVFHKFYETIDSFERNELESSILVITGDILHNKDSLSAEQIMITRQFLDQCSKRLPVLLMAGNHDLCLSNKSRLDSITPIVSGLSNVIYFSQSGIYRYHDITFAVNTLSTNYYDNEIDEIIVNTKQPQFIKYSDIDSELKQSKKCIALFHGMIEGAKNDCNYSFTCNVNMSWFDGYDFVLLGDIHRHQYLKNNMAYAGSFIQQNFGESVENHGFICWDLENRTSKFYPVENDFCFYSCLIDKSEKEILKDLKGKKEINLRIFYKEVADEKKVVKIIANLKKNGILVNEHYLLKEYDSEIKDKDTISYEKNMSCIEHQNELISKEIDDKDLLQEIIKLNTEIYKEVHKSEIDTSKNMSWKLKRLLFKNVYSYTENNSKDAEDGFHEIDFENFELNTKTGIFGNNHVGKSSIMDIILFALFDKTSRGKKSDILSKGKKSFEIILDFSVDNKNYRITKKANKRGACLKTTCEFKEIDDENSPNHTGSDRHETNNIMKEMLCEFDDLVFISFLFQNNFNGFLDLGNSEKVKFFQKMLKISDFEKQCEIAKNKLFSLQKDLESNQKRLIEIEKDTLTSSNFDLDPDLVEQNIQQLEKDKEVLLSDMSLLTVNMYEKIDETSYETICQKITKTKQELPENELCESSQSSFDECLLRQIIENYEKFNAEKIKNLSFISSKKRKLQDELIAIDNLDNDTVDESLFRKAKDFLNNPVDFTCDKNLIQEHKNKKAKMCECILKKQDLESKLSKLSSLQYIDYDPNCKFCQKTFKSQMYETELNQVEQEIALVNEFLKSNDEIVNSIQQKIESYEKDKISSESIINKYNKYLLFIENKEWNEIVCKAITLVDEEYSNVEKQVFPDYENKTEIIKKVKNLRELENQKLKHENTKVYFEMKTKLESINKELFTNRQLLQKNASNQALLTYCKNSLIEISESIEKLKKQIFIYSKYVEVFGKSGIPNMLIQQTIPNIQKLFNEYSTSLELGIKYKIEIDSNDCKNIEIYCNDIPIDICSGFEKLITSIFMRIAIKKTHYVKSNFIFIDEAFANMDSINFAKIPQILDLLQLSFEHIFIITHQCEIKEMMDNCISVERNNLTFTY